MNSLAWSGYGPIADVCRAVLAIWLIVLSKGPSSCSGQTGHARSTQSMIARPDTVHVILAITTLVLGFVITGLWGPNLEWLTRDDVEAADAAYIFKLVGIGLIVFFFIAITFGLLPDQAHFRL